MKCPNPNYVWPKGVIMAVPCGKCLACLSNKRDDWSFRLMQEFKVSSSAFFVTLTYHPKYYPSHGVSKRHIQLYMKRLRKKCDRLRYYAVGEYGSKSGRAHYHAVIFNCDEKCIRDAWSLFNKVTSKVEPIGIVHLGKVTEASVSYTLKYMVQKGGAIEGFNKPFSLMSRGYGLGMNYLTDAMLKWHRDGSYVYAVKDGEKVRLPRFYKEKIWPSTTWSDWQYRRDKTFKNARQEAERKDELENEMLRAQGIKDPEKYRADVLSAALQKIQSKTEFSQTF